MSSTSTGPSAKVLRVGLLLAVFGAFLSVAIPSFAEEWVVDPFGGSGNEESVVNGTWGEEALGAPSVMDVTAQDDDVNIDIPSPDPSVDVLSYVPQEAVWGESGDSFSVVEAAVENTEVLMATMCTTDAQCSDGNACTSDVCSNGSCINPFNNNPCDDGDACTAGDQCQTGTCLGSVDICMGQAPTRPRMPTQRPDMPSRTCSAGSRMCNFGPLGDACIDNDRCCSNNDCSTKGSFCSFSLTCDCSPGEHVCASIDTCSAGNCCPGDTCSAGQSCDDGNSCTNDVCVQQHNGTSTPYYLWEHQPIPLCGGCDANVGKACTSKPNDCGQTTDGKIQCDGDCSAKTPPITGTHLACALGQCIIFPNLPGLCTDLGGCKKPGDAC